MMKWVVTLGTVLVFTTVRYARSEILYSLEENDISYHACLIKCTELGWTLPMTKISSEFTNFQQKMINVPMGGSIMWMGLRKDWCSGKRFWQDGEEMTFYSWATLSGEPSNITGSGYKNRQEWCHYFRSYEDYGYSTMWCHYPQKIIECVCAQGTRVTIGLFNYCSSYGEVVSAESIIPKPIVSNQPSCAGSNGYTIDTSSEDYITATASCGSTGRLVTLDTQTKSNNFKDFMDEEVSGNGYNTDELIWIGLAYDISTGKFMWSFGNEAIWTSWANAQPNTNDGECVCTSPDLTYEWISCPCSDSNNIVCEPVPKVYWLSFWKENYDSASATCSGLGAKLAMPKTWQKIYDLATFLDEAYLSNRLAGSEDIWIGLRYKAVDSWFWWDDDNNVIWEYFDMYDPDMWTIPALDQCMVTMKNNGYRWHVANCQLDQRYFVCESDATINAPSPPPPTTTPMPDPKIPTNLFQAHMHDTKITTMSLKSGPGRSIQECLFPCIIDVSCAFVAFDQGSCYIYPANADDNVAVQPGSVVWKRTFVY